MSPSAQRSGGGKAGRAERLRGFARPGLVVAWVVFWLNTAVFPCCEVAAAVLGGQADNVSQAIATVQPAHSPDHTPSGSPLKSSDSPCGDTLNSESPLVEDHDGLTPDRSSLERVAVDAPVATRLPTVESANLVLARAAPPPSLRSYLRTQRLLI